MECEVLNPTTKERFWRAFLASLKAALAEKRESLGQSLEIIPVLAVQRPDSTKLQPSIVFCIKILSFSVKKANRRVSLSPSYLTVDKT